MYIVFQSIFTWAGPLQEFVETAQGAVGDFVAAQLSPGPLRSLLVDGVIAGVGGVLVFLPQIALLFLFIAVLEDCGYMARAAFLMDNVMSRLGLSGKSFVPLMSSFACAVPGVMATRVIENRADRLTTIMVAPLMSCSARLPVYLLLIGAFVPQRRYWGDWITSQGLALFAMTFSARSLRRRSLGCSRSFSFAAKPRPSSWNCRATRSRRCGWSCIAYGSLQGIRGPRRHDHPGSEYLVWAAAYFPSDHARVHQLDAEIESLTSASDDDQEAGAELERLEIERQAAASSALEASFLGRAGKAIEPAVKPLGWDWRIGVGALASFPAREVIIATLGTIYSLGGDVTEEDENLISALKSCTWPDGRPVYTLATAFSIMVFFALCAQCVSTLAVIKRETNSWGWAVFSFVYMTALAYVGALLTYQILIRFS